MAFAPRPGPKPASWPLPLWGGLAPLVAASDPWPLSLWSRIGVGQWVSLEGEREESLKHESDCRPVLHGYLGSPPHHGGIREAGMTVEAGICCIHRDDTLREAWWSRRACFLPHWSPTVFYYEPRCHWGRGQGAIKEECLGCKPFIWGLFCLTTHGPSACPSVYLPVYPSSRPSIFLPIHSANVHFQGALESIRHT